MPMPPPSLGEAIAPLKREIAERVAENANCVWGVAELRGKLDAVLTLLGQKPKLWKPSDVG
jgi:hypothetical protein